MHAQPIAARSSELNLERLAEGIRDSAVESARSSLHPLLRHLEVALLGRRPDFVSTFYESLAVSVSRALSRMDSHLLAVFRFSSPGEADPATNVPHPGMPLHLLAITDDLGATQRLPLIGLDRALQSNLRQLGWPRFAGSGNTRFLDINLLTPRELRRGVGYAGLFSAFYSFPHRIWLRTRARPPGSGVGRI